MIKSRRSQRGIALIIVLMVVAFVAILGTEMGQRLQLQIQRTANIKDSNQAYWYALGAEQYAKKSIKLLLEQANGVIHLNQPWSQQFLYPLEGGGIQADLVDMQSCFNLNALAQTAASSANQSTAQNATDITDAMLAFHRLLLTRELIPEMDSFTADTVRDSLADWLDKDDNLRSFGAEDVDYESLPAPYLTANTLMVNKSELRLVNGVSPQWINVLLPLVCAVPDKGEMRLNVNTITDEQAAVLAAVTGMDVDQAQRLIASRPQDGYQNISEFMAEPDIEALSLSAIQQDWFDITTQYFILHTKTRYNNATFSMSSVFYIDDTDNISVVRREFGGKY